MNIQLREWNRDDANVLVDVVNHTNRKWMRRLGQGEYTLDDAVSFIDNAKSSNNGIYRAIIKDGKVVGSILVEKGRDMTGIDGSISYYVRQDCEGSGIVTKAVQSIVDDAFCNLGIVRLSAYVCTKNVASMRVLEKNGFKQEGIMRKSALIDGEIVDVAIYAIVR